VIFFGNFWHFLFHLITLIEEEITDEERVQDEISKIEISESDTNIDVALDLTEDQVELRFKYRKDRGKIVINVKNVFLTA